MSLVSVGLSLGLFCFCFRPVFRPLPICRSVLFFSPPLLSLSAQHIRYKPREMPVEGDLNRESGQSGLLGRLYAKGLVYCNKVVRSTAVTLGTRSTSSSAPLNCVYTWGPTPPPPPPPPIPHCHGPLLQAKLLRKMGREVFLQRSVGECFSDVHSVGDDDKCRFCKHG